MFVVWVAEHFEIVEYVLHGVSLGFICPPPDTFTFEKVEKIQSNFIVSGSVASEGALRDVIAVPTSVHKTLQNVLSWKQSLLNSG